MKKAKEKSALLLAALSAFASLIVPLLSACLPYTGAKKTKKKHQILLFVIYVTQAKQAHSPTQKLNKNQFMSLTQIAMLLF